jgi:hypothetical protein
MAGTKKVALYTKNTPVAMEYGSITIFWFASCPLSRGNRAGYGYNCFL